MYELKQTMPIKEAILLAGGLGTRLREAVPDLPKCMAPVAGRPFIAHVIDYWRMQGIQRFVFALGYKHEVIENYLREHYPTLSYQCVVEQEPLGTGGAIQLALQAATDEQVLVTNGDTLFKVKANDIATVHRQYGAVCTLALKPMQNFDRYGVVLLNEDNTVKSFKEKQFYIEGLINGGVYVIHKTPFLQHRFPEKFSMEKDYLEAYYTTGEIYGCIQEGYFIDIGIPADLEKAQTELAKPALDLKQVDRSWTLFLDRDGVINQERVGNYVLNWNEFVFNEGALDAFKSVSEAFSHIVIVSNQRGVGKGLMTEQDLQHIHIQMQKEVVTAGGRIDRIYYCTDVDNNHHHRKPNPGMAMQAAADFEDIDLSKSIMVGNKLSDMRFGRSAGMFTVFLATTNPETPYPHPDIDLRFNSLFDFAKALEEHKR